MRVATSARQGTWLSEVLAAAHERAVHQELLKGKGAGSGGGRVARAVRAGAVSGPVSRCFEASGLSSAVHDQGGGSVCGLSTADQRLAEVDVEGDEEVAELLAAEAD